MEKQELITLHLTKGELEDIQFWYSVIESDSTTTFREDKLAEKIAELIK